MERSDTIMTEADIKKITIEYKDGFVRNLEKGVIVDVVLTKQAPDGEPVSAMRIDAIDLDDEEIDGIVDVINKWASFTDEEEGEEE